MRSRAHTTAARESGVSADARFSRAMRPRRDRRAGPQPRCRPDRRRLARARRGRRPCARQRLARGRARGRPARARRPAAAAVARPQLRRGVARLEARSRRLRSRRHGVGAGYAKDAAHHGRSSWPRSRSPRPPRGISRPGHGKKPATIALPNGFQPGGARHQGSHLLHGVARDRCDLRWVTQDGTGSLLVQPQAGGSATGIVVDHGRLYVAGGATGKAFVYDARTGADLGSFQLATGRASSTASS